MARGCRGAVANMLVTSCKDNICRIWAETVLPDDGLIDTHQLDAAVSSQSAQLLSTQQHKKRFLQRLHHIRSATNASVHHSFCFCLRISLLLQVMLVLPLAFRSQFLCCCVKYYDQLKVKFY